MLWRYIQQGPAILNAYLCLRKATKLGGKVRVWGRPRIYNHGNMMFGERASIRSIVAQSEFFTANGARLEVGKYTFINYGASIAAHKLIRIGDHCLIGTHCIMMDNDFHHISVNKRKTLPESKPIILGNHVWLGNRVTVLKGVTIGDYAVVGAGSVVTRDIPSYSVAAGNPARIIRTLSQSNTGS